jgi:hypothetical protein
MRAASSEVVLFLFVASPIVAKALFRRRFQPVETCRM